MNFPAPEIVALEIGPNTQSVDVLENVPKYLHYTSAIYGYCLPK
jgi:hypothetical protein